MAQVIPTPVLRVSVQNLLPELPGNPDVLDFSDVPLRHEALGPLIPMRRGRRAKAWNEVTVEDWFLVVKDLERSCRPSSSRTRLMKSIAC